MNKKTVKLNKNGIGNLPNNKPSVYKILTETGQNNYTGIAKKGRLQERLKDHLPNGADPIPGVKIQIEQMSNIRDAQKKESNIISRSQPKYNIKGK